MILSMKLAMKPDSCFLVRSQSVQKIIGVTDLQRRLKAVLDEVADEHVPYVLIRGSQPRAALVPYEEFLRYQELQEGEVLRRFGRLRARMAEASAGLSEEEVEAEVKAARAELKG
jgi:prevent-host-death family protein